MVVPFLDHGDFFKSRKAVIISSVSLIVIGRFTIIENKLDLFGVKIAVEQKDILEMVTVAVLYFMYVFLLRSYQHLIQIRYDKYEQDGRQQFEGIDPSNLVIRYSEMLKNIKATIIVGVDFAPVLILGSLALYHFGIFPEIRS